MTDYNKDMQSTPEPELPNRNRVRIYALVVLLILAGLVLSAFFGYRLAQAAASLRHARLQPGETDVELIRPWMTIPYIARIYRVPEETLWEGLGIPPAGNRHKSLRTLDSEYAGGRPGAILNKVKDLILHYQEQPTPTPAPSTTPSSTPSPGAP